MNQPDQLFKALAYLEQASALRQDSNYPAAIKTYQKAAEIYRQLSLWEKYIQTRNDIDRYSLKYQVNETTYQQIIATLKVTQEKLGESHPAFIQIYFNLGTYFIFTIDEEQAFAYLKKGISINKKLFGDKHQVTANFYDAIGYIYSSKRNYNRALSYREKALIIRLQLFGENHKDVAESYANMGVCHWHKEEYNNTLDYTKRALEILKNISGHFHPDVATTYNNLGKCYETLEQLPKALKAYQVSLHINQNVLDKNHYNFSRILNNLGNCYVKMQDYEKALDYYSQTLPFIVALETQNEITAQVYTQMGYCLLALQNSEHAMAYLDKAKAIYNQQCPNKIADLLIHITYTAAALLAQNQLTAAFEQLQQAFTIYQNYQKTLRNKSGILYTYLVFSNYYQKTGNLAQSISYLENALVISEQLRPEKPRLVAIVYQALGDYYLQQQEVEKGQSFLNQAATIFAKVFEDDTHPAVSAIQEKIKE